VALTVCATRAPAQEKTALPSGVTEEMIAQGAEVYKGPGICSSCHGPDGQGVPNLGSNLADAEWTHSDGSFEGILKSIETGVGADKSTNGVAMPPKGGGPISDEQLSAVAAYVWSLSQPSK
jgi:mono/diheme cytochrome c family protein